MSDNPQVNQAPPSPETTSVQDLGLFKKFGNDLSQWDNSYWNIVEQRKAEQARADAAEQRAMQLEQYLLSQGRQDPHPPQDPWNQIVGQEGVDPNLLRTAVQQDARKGALEVFQQLLGPMANAWQARERLAQQYQDYPSLEPELTKFVQSDPEFKRKYDAALAVSPETAEMATELALLRYKASKPLPSPVNAQDRSAAGIPNTAGAGSVGESPTAAFEQELQAAVQLAERTGDKGPLYIAVSKLARFQAGEQI